MNTLTLAVLLAFCCYLGAAGTLVPYQVYEVKYGPTPLTVVSWDPSSCGSQIDLHIRTTYYYYLENAQLCYVNHVSDAYGLLYIHQYRNYIGTFYSISRYGTPSKKINIVTFVRLGDGWTTTRSLAISPYYVRPFTISLDLGWGRYFVPRWETQPNWSWGWAKTKFYQTEVAAVAAHKRCVGFEAFTRKTYWYYLDKAVILSESNYDFNSHCYCSTSYVNRIGTWQVIGYDGPKGYVISTMVRLGDGYEEPCETETLPSFTIKAEKTLVWV